MDNPLGARTDNTPDWFYPEWASSAPGSAGILVRDTDSALGRYSLHPKAIGLKDLARMHGHLCDGLVISFVEIKAVLERLFPTGIADRTDLRAVSKNGPCWLDTVALMTGARINFQTLRIDNIVGDGFIIQRVSTSEAYAVHLKSGVFPKQLTVLEREMRAARTHGHSVSAADIDGVEAMAKALSRALLNARAEDVLDVQQLEGFRFVPNDSFGERGDVINKDMPR
jgi:formylmethanofuran dehydrogenase subunit E